MHLHKWEAEKIRESSAVIILIIKGQKAKPHDKCSKKTLTIE